MVAGAIVYPPRTKADDLAIKIFGKFLKGCGGTSFKKFPHKNITRTKYLLKKVPHKIMILRKL